MKLSKFANLVKNGGRCAVLHVAGSGIWLSTGTAIYRATELPDMEGSEQVRTVLDMTADAWKKVYLTEDWPESVSNVLGLNLAPYAQGEQDTEKLKVAAAPNGLWCSACRGAGMHQLRYASSYRIRFQALFSKAQDRAAGEVLQQLSTVQRGVGQRPACPQIRRLRCRGDAAHPTRRTHRRSGQKVRKTLSALRMGMDARRMCARDRAGRTAETGEKFMLFLPIHEEERNTSAVGELPRSL